MGSPYATKEKPGRKHPVENLNGSILGKDVLCYAAWILYYPFLIMILGPYICRFEEVEARGPARWPGSKRTCEGGIKRLGLQEWFFRCPALANSFA
jgi:hypothetical protein